MFALTLTEEKHAIRDGRKKRRRTVDTNIEDGWSGVTTKDRFVHTEVDSVLTFGIINIKRGPIFLDIFLKFIITDLIDMVIQHKQQANSATFLRSNDRKMTI